jgi:hypothetical protein
MLFSDLDVSKEDWGIVRPTLLESFLTDHQLVRKT